MDEKVYINFDNYNPRRIDRPISKPKEHINSKSEELPVERAEIFLSDILVIGVHTINIMGTKVGDDISKLEAVLCNQGIKYKYSDSTDYPSKLLVVDDNYVFTTSDKAAKFNLQVLCDDGYKISSYFFRSEYGSEYGSMIDAINDTTDIFLSNKNARSKKKVMDEVLCVRQDFYTKLDVAKIEKSDQFVTLEIMSKVRFEEVVLKWYEKERLKNIIPIVIDILLVLIYPIGHLLSYDWALTMTDVSQFFVDLLGSFLIVSFLFAIGMWLYLVVTGKDDETRVGCFVYIVVLGLPVIIAFLSRACDSPKPVQKSYGIYNTGTQTEDRQEPEKGVYICTGPQSKRYHYTRYCRGLESCSDDIELVDVSEAEDKGRTPCRICY